MCAERCRSCPLQRRRSSGGCHRFRSDSNRTGYEFDYGAVHAVQAIREAGHEAILVNNNPETVSTDFDTASSVPILSPLNASLKFSYAKADGILLQFGGQTAINLALPLDSRMEHLSEQGLTCSMLGTSPDAVDEASDRERFEAFGKRSIIRLPEGRTGKTPDSIRAAVAEIGYPVLVRPSYVLGGRGMEILSDDAQLETYMSDAYIAPDKPLLVDEYLGGAIELDVDAVCDGEDVLVGAVMEHLEEAGIHSGDSTCFIPTQNVSDEILTKVHEWTKEIGLGLNIRGCFNIQFCICRDELYVLEVNPRGSRTFPFVAKATGSPWLESPLTSPSVSNWQTWNSRRQTDAVCVKLRFSPSSSCEVSILHQALR